MGVVLKRQKKYFEIFWGYLKKMKFREKKYKYCGGKKYFEIFWGYFKKNKSEFLSFFGNFNQNFLGVLQKTLNFQFFGYTFLGVLQKKM